MSSKRTGLRRKAGPDKNRLAPRFTTLQSLNLTGLCGSHNRCTCGSKGTPVVNQETKVERGRSFVYELIRESSGGSFLHLLLSLRRYVWKMRGKSQKAAATLDPKKALRSDATAKWIGDDRPTIQGTSHVIQTQNKKERESCFVWKRLDAKTSEVHNCQGESEARLRGRSIALRSHKASSFSLSLLRSLHLSFSFLTRLARKLFPQPIPHRNAHCK